MKKLAILGASLVLVFTTGTAVFAAGHGCRSSHAKAEECRYIDEDRDGLCDNCQFDDTHHSSKGYNCRDNSGTSADNCTYSHHSSGHGHKNHH